MSVQAFLEDHVYDLRLGVATLGVESAIEVQREDSVGIDRISVVPVEVPDPHQGVGAQGLASKTSAEWPAWTSTFIRISGSPTAVPISEAEPATAS